MWAQLFNTHCSSPYHCPVGVRPRRYSQHVELAEVGVHQPALVVDGPHHLHHVQVQLTGLGAADGRVLRAAEWGMTTTQKNKVVNRLQNFRIS